MNSFPKHTQNKGTRPCWVS